MYQSCVALVGEFFGGLGGILAVCNIMNLGHFNYGLVGAIPGATAVQRFWYLKLSFFKCVS